MQMPDSDNPWFVLIPRVDSTKEWHHLSMDNQIELVSEINTISSFLEDQFSPDKINIGSLGNIVPQLHVHIIARFKEDKAWPGTIWGSRASKNMDTLNKWKSLAEKSLFLS